MLGLRAVLLFALGTLAGCGYSGGDLCDDACECVGCSENRLNECHDTADRCEDVAFDLGCGDFHDDLLACAAETGRCDTEAVRYRANCDAERRRLENCMGPSVTTCLR